MSKYNRKLLFEKVWNNMKRDNRKVLAGFLAAAMVFGMTPLQAFAAEGQQKIPGSQISAVSQDSKISMDSYVQHLFRTNANPSVSLHQHTDMSLLSGMEKDLYDKVVQSVKSVAAGERQSTVFSYIETTNCTPGNINATGQQAINSLKKAYEFARTDCPYDMFWADTSAQMNGTTEYDYGRLTLQLTLTVKVSSDYAENGQSGTSQVADAVSAKMRTAHQASANAQSLVSKNASQSDYQKLEAYKDYLCKNVSYNYSAAEGTQDYGDPWQMVYVFDDNPKTNVVCEGYAKAFQYLCDLTHFSDSTVQSYLVGGTLASADGHDGPHAWNVVSIDGTSYLVDVTNCDIEGGGTNDELFLTGASGSVDAGYKVAFGSSWLKYDYSPEETLPQYTTTELTLSSRKYDASAATPANSDPSSASQPSSNTPTVSTSVSASEVNPSSPISKALARAVRSVSSCCEAKTSCAGWVSIQLGSGFANQTVYLYEETGSVLSQIQHASYTADSSGTITAELPEAGSYVIAPISANPTVSTVSGTIEVAQGNTVPFHVYSGTSTDSSFSAGNSAVLGTRVYHSFANGEAYYGIYGGGKLNAQAGVYANGVKLLTVKMVKAPYTSDTTVDVQKKQGQVYWFSVKPDDANAKVGYAVGNGQVLSTRSKGRDSDGNYLFGFKVIGSAGNKTGVYVTINGTAYCVFNTTVAS